ncbi:MAG: hypothetical protein JOY69_02535 [Candidatus Eremiobacteraeota bacterium]|nr:hypothetical protein [Candidatus Eremiobacteraeota bacterium]
MFHKSRRGRLRWLMGAMAAGVLSACSGSGERTIPGTSGSQPATGSVAQSSWMDPRAKHHALLYVSDVVFNRVSVYSYPDLAPMGVLTGVKAPEGMCTDPRNGNVWITEIFASRVVEFAHGATTPIRTLADQPDAYVEACAVNPTNGDLAVANRTIQGEDPGDLVIFKRGQGKPIVYSDPKMFLFVGVGYDAAGNAFVDGNGFHGQNLRLDELTAGANQLGNVPWKGPTIRLEGDVRATRSGLLVGDAAKRVIYETNKGTVTGTIRLDDACTVYQFTIDHGKLIAASVCASSGAVLIYDYPAGGKPVAKLTGFTTPGGVTISR